MNLLACDLGGTKTLLGIYKDEGYLKQLYKKSYISKEWQSFEKLLNDFLVDLPISINKPEYACIACAGQVINKSVKITNLLWSLNEQELCHEFSFKELNLINDFAVIVFGIPYFQKKQYSFIQSPIQKCYKNQTKIISIVGAGTGLGSSKGLISDNNIISLPSESGHAEFSPRNKQEWDFCNWIKDDLNLKRVSIERVVSGKGLSDIARWKIEVKNLQNHPLCKLAQEFKINRSNDFSSQVTKYASTGDSDMKEVLEIWLSAYGSMAGDIALKDLCTEGLWIAGGIAAKNLELIKSMTFINSLRNKGRFSSFIEKIPIMVLTDPEAGLFSAACKANLISKSSLST